MTENSNDLASRVDDIEKTIGDIAQALEALKNCLASAHLPTCPPYCAHGVESEYVDERSLQEQVAEIAKFIGDLGAVFGCLNNVLASWAQPTCPPYCAH